MHSKLIIKTLKACITSWYLMQHFTISGPLTVAGQQIIGEVDSIIAPHVS